MADFTITVARSARREIEALDTTILKRIFPKLEALAREPRPQGCRKLRGESNLWRIRIGDHRVLYSVDDALRLVDIVAIRHRSQAYL